MKSLALLLASVLLAPASETTGTTILVKKTLTELTTESSLIVVARVESTKAAWNAERTVIWTTATLSVADSWKGVAPEKIAVLEPGGEVGDVGQRVPSMARYRVGERVVVFLSKDAQQQWRTHGCVQGRFALLDDRGQDARVTLGAEQREVVKGVFADPSILPTLASFEAAVRARLKKSGAPK